MDSRKTSCMMARQMALVRQKKVQNLRNRIETGKYQIQNKDLAKALFPVP